MLHKAVLDACDALDGVKDGVLENPTQCRFDPKVVLCKGADGPDCLTAPQVEAAQEDLRRRVEREDARAAVSGPRARQRDRAGTQSVAAQSGRLRRRLLQVHRVQGREVGSEGAELRQRRRR